MSSIRVDYHTGSLNIDGLDIYIRTAGTVFKPEINLERLPARLEVALDDHVQYIPNALPAASRFGPIVVACRNGILWYGARIKRDQLAVGQGVDTVVLSTYSRPYLLCRSLHKRGLCIVCSRGTT